MSIVNQTISHQENFLVVAVFLVQSGDISTAESLFKKSTKKNLPLYGLMMKGMNKKDMLFVPNRCS